MALTAAQYSDIATAYEKAAADPMMPAPQKTAFARKAEWFRFLAQVGAKKAAKSAASKKEPLHETCPEDFRAFDEIVTKRAGR
jgi:hypothetical protein